MTGGTMHVFLFPGVLARCEELFAPLQPVLARFDNDQISYVDYRGKAFRPEAIAAQLAGSIAELDGRILLIGASLGGDLIPFVVEQLKPADRRRCKVVVIDAPAGADTLVQVPARAEKFLTSRWGWLASPLSKIKLAPKASQITVPVSPMIEELTGREMSEDEWRLYVKRTARRNLGGHSARQWQQQLAWMMRIGNDGSLERACRSLSDVARVSYVECLQGDDVVVHATAIQRWRKWVGPKLNAAAVNGTHCGFLQNQPEFTGVLRSLVVR